MVKSRVIILVFVCFICIFSFSKRTQTNYIESAPLVIAEDGNIDGDNMPPIFV